MWFHLLVACLLIMTTHPGMGRTPERMGFTASEVEAPGPLAPLRGTLLTPPSATAPVALLLPGSGPTDRDGNNPLGVRAASLRLLAEGLAAHGIASARIDKRGMFGNSAAVADANDVTLDDYAADTANWIAVLRQARNARCVWLIGHSEGGLVALATAARARADICGIVLVATAGRRIGDVLRAQLAANPANAAWLAQAEDVIAALEAGRRVDVADLHPSVRMLFAPATQRFWISTMQADPAKLIGAYDGPVLIVQGTRDIQVGVEDAELLHRANPAARLALIPDANHVLKRVASADRAANLATYADPHLPLAPGIVETIATFIGAHTAR